MRFQDMTVLKLYHGYCSPCYPGLQWAGGEQQINRKTGKLWTLLRRRMSFSLQQDVWKHRQSKRLTSLKRNLELYRRTLKQAPETETPPIKLGSSETQIHLRGNNEFSWECQGRGSQGSHQGVQRSSGQEDKATLQQAVELGSIMLIFVGTQNEKLRSLKIMQGTTIVAEPYSLQGDPENPGYATVQMKPKFQ